MIDEPSVKKSRRLLLALIVVSAFAVVIVAAVAYWTVVPSAPRDVEVAVLLPTSESSSWRDFVRAVELAAAERNIAVHENPATNSCTVDSPGLPIRFQWYPFLGSYQMQRTVDELCSRAHPPIGIVGANNTALTRMVGSAIRESSRPDWVPILMMTYATADKLIDINPGRSFRFGFSNRYQAKAVVAELTELVHQPPQAIVVQVLDNPFTTDLADDFAKELTSQIHATIIPPPEVFADHRKDGLPIAWSLKTGTTTPGSPNKDERELAKAIVSAFSREPDRASVLVLPLASSAFSNMAASLESAIQSQRARHSGSDVGNLTILTGDSLDYYDFVTKDPESLRASSMPGRVVFFSHVNPVDPTIKTTPENRGPAISLNRDVVRTLLDVLPTLGDSPDPDSLVRGLKENRKKRCVQFVDHERSGGGGVIVANPDRAKNRFEFVLPADWRGGEK